MSANAASAPPRHRRAPGALLTSAGALTPRSEL
jgi:hypothetical protein